MANPPARNAGMRTRLARPARMWSRLRRWWISQLWAITRTTQRLAVMPWTWKAQDASPRFPK
jgi:hypothetical protein